MHVLDCDIAYCMEAVVGASTVRCQGIGSSEPTAAARNGSHCRTSSFGPVCNRLDRSHVQRASAFKCNALRALPRAAESRRDYARVLPSDGRADLRPRAVGPHALI